jgi:hypothetical protein
VVDNSITFFYYLIMGQKIDEKIVKTSQNVDPICVVELVKSTPNDMVLGKLIREYVLNAENQEMYEN